LENDIFTRQVTARGALVPYQNLHPERAAKKWIAVMRAATGIGSSAEVGFSANFSRVKSPRREIRAECLQIFIQLY
jgi:hypothetical protein